MPPATVILPANPSRVRSLPIEQWPSADRDAWIVACRPSQRLIRGGAGAHMKPITLSDLARRYGYFLDCMNRRGLLDRSACCCRPGYARERRRLHRGTWGESFVCHHLRSI